MGDDDTRSIEVEREVSATPDEVWRALTTSEGLRSWFPLDARVTPGIDGRVWLSWGPGVEGEAPIHVWEPGTRFGWTEDHGTDPSGRPIRVAVDFYIESGPGGQTTVRLVQSGFSAGSEWDEMYDAIVDGWTYFLFNLVYYFARHAGKKRTMVWTRLGTDLGRDLVWDRLVEAALVAAGTSGAAATVSIEAPHPASLVSAREGYHFAATLPDLDDSILFVEIEGKHVGFWLSTYGIDDDRVGALQAALDDRVRAALGA